VEKESGWGDEGGKETEMDTTELVERRSSETR
jgi:hypothetical protein